MKKVISMFLVIVFVFSLSSIATITADASNTKKGTYGKNIKYSWNLKTGVITISGTGKMKEPKSCFGVLWNNSMIKKAIVKEGITSLCTYAFFWCTHMSSISLPDSLKSIGSFAFEWNCAKTITIPKNVDYIGYNVFKSDTKLEKINVAKENNYFKSVDGVLFNKGGTTLYACPSRKTGELTVINTVESINDFAFMNCDITGLTLPASFKNMFENSLFGTDKLKYINVAEENEQFYTKKGILYDKKKNYLVKIPSSISGDIQIDDGTKSIRSSAFSSCCHKVGTITIPDSVETICASSLCGYAKVIKLGKGVKYIGYNSLSGADTVIFSADVDTLKGRAFKGNVKAYYDIKNIANDAFKDATVYTHCNVKTVINHFKKHKHGKLKVLHEFSKVYEKKAPTYFDVGYTKGYCKYCKKTEYNYKAKLKLKCPNSFKAYQKKGRLYVTMPKIKDATGYQIKADGNAVFSSKKLKFNYKLKKHSGIACARAYIKKGKKIAYSSWTDWHYCK